MDPSTALLLGAILTVVVAGGLMAFGWRAARRRAIVLTRDARTDDPLAELLLAPASAWRVHLQAWWNLPPRRRLRSAGRFWLLLLGHLPG